MPPEVAAVFMKKLLGCKQLSDSVKAKNKQLVLDALIECAMTDIQLVRHIPGLDKLGLSPVINDEQEAEFKINLRKICNP